METALVIGGTRFLGRHLVEYLAGSDYEVTIFNRGRHENPFASDPRIQEVTGDRSDADRLLEAARKVAPAVVFDMVGYHPAAVEGATEIFAGSEAYVYVSSGAAYQPGFVPKREDETPLKPCSSSQAVSDSPDTYGNRKAAGDRVVARAAKQGVNAMAVRPPVIYGPYDYTERLDYWLHRIDTYDRILVPGDGTNIWHRAFVEDVARALVLLAERGDAGERYNVGDRNVLALSELLERFAEAMGTDVELVYASGRELSIVGLEPADFPLYRSDPHLLETAKIAELGFESTSKSEAIERTVFEHLDSSRTGDDQGPAREVEARLLDVLASG
ncbi:MAG: NAD-dependent epimerase/dehydratase family protein [Halodesulfurarchaeum sp.]